MFSKTLKQVQGDRFYWVILNLVQNLFRPTSLKTLKPSWNSFALAELQLRAVGTVVVICSLTGLCPSGISQFRVTVFYWFWWAKWSRFAHPTVLLHPTPRLKSPQAVILKGLKIKPVGRRFWPVQNLFHPINSHSELVSESITSNVFKDPETSSGWQKEERPTFS